MPCEYGRDDCATDKERCYLCIDAMYYTPPKQRKAGLAKRSDKGRADGRKGSEFEARNHDSNRHILSGATARMTPNSGAGRIKGDEEIRGAIEIMEELKQQNKELAKGNKSFSIQRAWLEKLDKEAKAANKEFWYLKFSFGDEDQKTYVTIDQDVIMSMVYTMVEDRKKAKLSDAKIDVAEKHRRLIETQNVSLMAEIELLKAQLNLKRLEEGIDE